MSIRNRPSTHRTAGKSASPDSPLIQQAIEYAALGLKVLPVKDRSKVPRQRSWVDKATSDPRVIRGWPRTWYDGNLGLLTGGRLMAVDVDPRNKGNDSFEALVAEHGEFPATAEALTGGGGRHFLYEVPPMCVVGSRTNWRPGIDIKGERGYIVVQPSTHPDTLKDYAWVRHPRSGIAPAPEWLIEMIRNREDRTPTRPASARPARRRAGDETGLQLESARPARRRAGDGAGLLREIVNRYSVPQRGHRYKLMVRAVGSLMSRGYGDDLIFRVLMAWWGHFHAHGKVGTGYQGMVEELKACIESTARSKTFQVAQGDEWHQNQCRLITLDADQRRLLRAPLPLVGEPADRFSQASPPPPPCKRVTSANGRLCVSEDEELFVEALIVHVTHQRLTSGRVVIRMTDDEIRHIARSRRGDIKWPWASNNVQTGRFKKKYFARKGRPATRFELLRLVKEGRRGAGSLPGLPSEYETTGIEILLKAEARRPTFEEVRPVA